MNPDSGRDAWTQASTYESYVGRWSRLVSRVFLERLEIAPHRRWLDVGCGTGALTEAILSSCRPKEVLGIDLSLDYVAYASGRLGGDVARFETGDAQALPVDSGTFDVSVSGLALNFVPAPARAVSEMARAVTTGGCVAAYVWDYADRMELMRRFWDAAVALHPDAAGKDEGVRFPICNADSLAELWRAAGLGDIRTEPIDVPTRFTDFDDFWTPFLGGQGPAPGYAMSLSEIDRARLRDRVKAGLPIRSDGSIDLVARAWAVSGLKSGERVFR